MSGEYKRLSSRIKEDSLSAIYVHCYSHRLNLALQDSCESLKQVRNTLGQINSVYNLISDSSKRNFIYKKLQFE